MNKHATQAVSSIRRALTGHNGGTKDLLVALVHAILALQQETRTANLLQLYQQRGALLHEDEYQQTRGAIRASLEGE